MTLYEQLAKNHDDVGLIEHPECWPLGTCLPVKKTIHQGQMPAIGLILNPECCDNVEFIVFETSMYDADFKNCPQHKFNIAEEIVVAGWQVD